MITRAVLISVLTIGLLAAPLCLGAQQAVKLPRIGWLGLSPGGANPALLQGLRDLGYVEGRNFVIEYRIAEGKPERYLALAAELVALEVDVIVAPNTPAALAAKQRPKPSPSSWFLAIQ